MLGIGFVVTLAVVAGCKSAPSEEEAIRTAIRQRLVSLGNLNLQAMDLNFTRISIQSNQARAEVDFRPKTGAPTGATMQVTYQLEKQDGTWRVVKTALPGGMIEHPATAVNPHAQGANAAVHGKFPNFQDVLDGGANAGAPPASPPSAASATRP
jgi:hypothetical protein